MDFDDDTPVESVKYFKLFDVENQKISHYNEFTIKGVLCTNQSLRILNVSFPSLKYTVTKN